MKFASAVLTVILVVAAALILWLASTGLVIDIYTVTYKTALQVFVIVLGGHVLSIVMSKINHEREETRAWDEQRRAIFNALRSSFFDVKRVRRIVRATNSSADVKYPSSVLSRSYAESMEQINDIQLSLESLAREIESCQVLFKDYAKLQANVDSLEEYLNGMIGEYEHTHPVVTGEPPRINLSDTPKFSDLISEYKESQFRIEFVKPFYVALDIVRSSLLLSGDNKSSKGPVQAIESSQK